MEYMVTKFVEMHERAEGKVRWARVVKNEPRVKLGAEHQHENGKRKWNCKGD